MIKPDNAEEYVHGVDPERRDRSWRFNREVSIPTVLTVIIATVSLMAFIFDLRTRISVIEITQALSSTSQKTIDERQDGEALRYQVRMDTQYAEINGKLGQLLGNALSGAGGRAGSGAH